MVTQLPRNVLSFHSSYAISAPVAYFITHSHCHGNVVDIHIFTETWMTSSYFMQYDPIYKAQQRTNRVHMRRRISLTPFVVISLEQRQSFQYPAVQLVWTI